jgi:hypothetical protein
MITELYKILFEVLFLHEYYLTDSDQRSVFDAGTIADPGAYLAKRLQQGLPSTLDGVQIAVPPATQAVFNRQQMRLITGYSGLQVAVRVTAAKQADGSTTYSPVVPWDDATSLLLLLQERSGGLSAISNGRMQRNTDGIYFFCNAPVSGARTFPSLSNPIPAKASNYVYEQGELVKDGKTVKAFYSDGKNAQFLPVTGDGFVNESDRMLVGTSFVYRFKPTDGVTNASFSLSDPAGKVLKTINVKASGPLIALSLDFSQDDEGNPLLLSTVENANAIIYTLKVTGSGNYSQTLPLVFYGDPIELGSSWGAVQIQAGVAAGAFSLVDPRGNLQTRVTADGTVQPPPSFQLRVKSPLRFRKYINDAGLALSAPAGNLTPFLQQSGSVLTTLTPVPLTYLPYFFSTNPTAKSPTWVYLPAPGPGSATESSNDQFFSVIRVPVSKLFPISQ